LLFGQADETAIERDPQPAHIHRCIYKPWNEEELLKTIKQGMKKL